MSFIPFLGSAFLAHAAPPTDDELIQINQQLNSLQQTIKTQQEASKKQQQQLTKLQRFVHHSHIALDNRHPAEKRNSSINALVTLKDERCLFIFRRIAIADLDVAVQIHAIKAASAFPASPEALAIAQLLLSRATSRLSTQEAAIEALINIKSDKAAETLAKASSNPKLANTIRNQARNALIHNFPEWLRKNGPPKLAKDALGTSTLSLGTGVAGSILLSTIGILGDSEEGTIIGGISGLGIGAATGYIYTRENPVSSGQGLFYLTSIGWGTASSIMLNETFDLGDQLTGSIATVSTAGAVAYSFRNRKKNPSVQNVLEVNVAGFVGAQLGLGAAEVANIGDQGRSASVLTGSLIGLGTGYALHKPWQLNSQSALFASVYGLEGLVIGSMLPEIIDTTDTNGVIRLTTYGAGLGGLVLSHYRPSSLKQSVLAGYGGLSGHGLGYGLPRLFNSSNKLAYGSSIALGTAGLIGGSLLAPLDKSSTNDKTTIGVGLPLLFWNSMAISSIASDKNLISYDQSSGLFWTLQGLGQLGLYSATQRLEWDKSDALFSLSAGAWGGYYGIMIPLAIGANGDGTDLLISTLVASDVATALSIYATSPRGFVQSKETVYPQLAAISGASLGALISTVFEADSQGIAISSIGGSIVGFSGGMWLNNKLNSPKVSMWTPTKPKFLDSWKLAANPLMMEDGSQGIYLQLHHTGQ